MREPPTALSCALGERVYSWLHRPDVPWLGVEPNIPAPLLVVFFVAPTCTLTTTDGLLKEERHTQQRDKSRRETFAAGNNDTRSQLRPSLTGEEEFSPFTASSLLHTEYRETDIFLFCRHSTVVPPPWLTLRVKQEKNFIVSFQTEDGTVNHGCCIVITCCQLSVVLRGAGGPGRAPGEQEQRVAIQGGSRGHLSTAGRLRNGV